MERVDTDIIESVSLAPDVAVGTGVGAIVAMVTDWRTASQDFDICEVAVGVDVDYLDQDAAGIV